MPTTRFTDEQVTLCLAALAYRGFQDASLARLHTDGTRSAISRGLAMLAPLSNQWDLVWGPAAYRAPLSVFDDELMYVVRSRENRSRYVVAIRGTNPIAAFDWLFGDLWSGRQTPWPYGDGTARISLSTALGLAVLQGLRSNGPRTDTVAAIWQTVDQWSDGVRAVASPLLEWLGSVARAPLAAIRARFFDLLHDGTGQRASSRTARQCPRATARARVLWQVET